MTREEAYQWNKNSHDRQFTAEIEDMEESIHFLLKKCFDSFDKQLKANQDQIRKAQNIIIEERITNDKLLDAVSRGGFELKLVNDEYILVKE